ncbi:MAG: hypothetical protein ABI649_06445 [Gaiellaceae bacterium]
MKVLPGLAPACIHVLGDPGAEDLPQTLLAARPSVGGEFDAPIDLDFLETFRKEVDQDGTRLLAALSRDANRDAAEK